MTLDEFYIEFENVCKSGKFELLFNTDSLLYLRSKKTGIRYCPITVVCDYKYNEFHTIGGYDIAAERLGLDPDMAKLIVYVADNHIMNDNERQVRSKLISIINSSIKPSIWSRFKSMLGFKSSIHKFKDS